MQREVRNTRACRDTGVQTPPGLRGACGQRPGKGQAAGLSERKREREEEATSQILTQAQAGVCPLFHQLGGGRGGGDGGN